ncbi:MAG: hypothetical protein J7M38_09575 [Armatimonadetes bacterium]|nr:hypothetical protein [Armatimonadota bacterium]
MTTAGEDRHWGRSVTFHLGLLIVCAGAAYTIHPEGWFSTRQWISFALIGFALVISAAVTRGRVASSYAGRLLLALGAATALYLAYDPPLADVPGLSALTVGFLGAFNPGVAVVGVVVMLLAWALQLVTGRDSGLEVRRLRIWVLVALGLVLALALIMQLALSSVYDLSGTTGNAELVFRLVQVAIVILASVEISGAGGVGALAHCYVGLALLMAAARNLTA